MELIVLRKRRLFDLLAIWEVEASGYEKGDVRGCANSFHYSHLFPKVGLVKGLVSKKYVWAEFGPYFYFS